MVKFLHLFLGEGIIVFVDTEIGLFFGDLDVVLRF
jgi:hypothetical protein